MELVKYFSKIDLVDLHPTLTKDALVQRGFDEHPQVTAISGMDVSGLGAHWDRYKNSPSDSNLQAVIDSCHDTTLSLAQYDVVASTCLISQILRNAHECIESSGMSPSQVQDCFPKVIGAIRDKHIELILDHTVSGGSAVLISDLTSATALPEMLASNADLNHLISTDVAQGNHFHGLNPLVISESTRHPPIAAKLAQVRVSSPWIWNAIEHHYLCLAYRLDRK